MNKAQNDAIERLRELVGSTHQTLVWSETPGRVKVTLDGMVEGIVNEDGKVHWRYTRGSLCDGCVYEFTPKGVK